MMGFFLPETIPIQNNNSGLIRFAVFNANQNLCLQTDRCVLHFKLIQKKVKF